MSKNRIKSRYLPERSFLYFRYPQANAVKAIEFYLPMLENIEISESQKPNLASYDLIGRAGTLYSYLGSKSREFNLKFNITLPNVLEYLGVIGLHSQFSNQFRYFYNESDNKERLKQKFDNYISDHSDSWDMNNFINFYKSGESIYYSVAGDDSANPDGITAFFSNLVKTGGALGSFIGGIFGGTGGTDNLKVLRQAVNAMMLWVGVIRSSTVNNAKNATLGPPSIYINHGSMYQSIPCVCTNYSIRLVNNVGYELISMTPRQIEVNMSLSENRVGDFGEWKPFDRIKGDNIAGWESIIEVGTMDPMNSTFGEYDLEEFTVRMRVDEERSRQRQEEMARMMEADPFANPLDQPELGRYFNS